MISPLQRLWKINFEDRGWPGEVPALVFLFNELVELRGIVASFRAEQPQPLRTHDEVQRAHDVLVQLVINQDLAEEIDPALIESLSHRLDILCWVLCHDHPQGFAEGLAAIATAFAELGIVVGRYETMQTGEPHE